MNKMMRWMLGSAVLSASMLVAAQVHAGEATQMWKCEADDDATEEGVLAHMTDWLAAARKIPGGEQLQAYVYHPIAVNSTGEHDFIFVVVAPSFEEWGKFWDGYPDSEAAQIEDDDEGDVVCPDSALWESIKLQTP